VFSRSRFPIFMFWAIVATLLLADNAMAYVGPGAGMEFITYAVGLLIMVGMAFFSILMWPFYSLMRWLRGIKPTATTTPATTAVPSINGTDPVPAIAPQDNAPSNPPAPPTQ
jgi:hypothetical protein